MSQRYTSYVSGLDIAANGGGFYSVANPPDTIRGTVRPFALLAHVRIPLKATEASPARSHIIASCSDFTGALGWAMVWDRETQNLEVFRSAGFLAYQYTAARGGSTASYSDVLLGLYAESGAAADHALGNNQIYAAGGATFVPAPAASFCLGGTDDAGLIGNFANPGGLAGGGTGDCLLSSFAVMATNVDPLIAGFSTQLQQIWDGMLERGTIPSDQPNLTHLFTVRNGIPGLSDNDNLDWVDDLGTGVTLTRTGTQTGAIGQAAQQRFLPMDV